jgi:hypothetical protein
MGRGGVFRMADAMFGIANMIQENIKNQNPNPKSRMRSAQPSIDADVAQAGGWKV